MTNLITLTNEIRPAGWFHVFISIAFLVTIINQSHFLPKQNVLALVCLISFLSSAAYLLVGTTCFPLGRLLRDDPAELRFFHRPPWTVPLIWVIAVLTSRDLARLVLRPWREAANYGWRVIGMTILLVILFNASLANPLILSRAFGINVAVIALTTLLILGALTPWLIQKKPAPQPKPDFVPVIIWLFTLVVLIWRERRK